MDMNLRHSAEERLEKGTAPATRGWAVGTHALTLLHGLATTPQTASDALKLLHELQVHQVELDLQAEDMRSTSAELEAALARQTQLYEAAPMAYLVMDTHTHVTELNAAGALHLGAPREAVLGQRLDRFLTPPSLLTLQRLLARVQRREATPPGVVVVQPPGQPPCAMAVSVSLDPAGTGFLVALCPMPDGLAP